MDKNKRHNRFFTSCERGKNHGKNTHSWGPGSGKTTLAQTISSRFHIPSYDLDTVNLEQGNALALVSHPAWITEGIYLISTEPMLYHADYIVLLEVSWPVASWRIIRRHLLSSLRGTQSYPGINGVKSLFKLLAYTGRYYLNQDHVTRPSIESLQRYLETYREIAAPPIEEFMQKYVEAYREIVVSPTENFMQKYLERYKEKLFLIRNMTDREHLLELLAKR